MSPEEIIHHMCRLQHESERIKDHFYAFLYNLSHDIKTSKTVKFEDIITFLKIRCDASFEGSSLSEVFVKLSKYVSFFDFGIIKLLTCQFGSNTLKKKLKKYKGRLREFCERRVCECPSNVFGDAEKGEKVYVIKIDESMYTLTVKQLEKLCFEINKILGHRFLRLLRVDEGCVRLTFRTFENDVFSVSQDQVQELRKLGILSIQFGEQFVKISDVSSKKGNC